MESLPWIFWNVISCLLYISFNNYQHLARLWYFCSNILHQCVSELLGTPTFSAGKWQRLKILGKPAAWLVRMTPVETLTWKSAERWGSWWGLCPSMSSWLTLLDSTAHFCLWQQALCSACFLHGNIRLLLLNLCSHYATTTPAQQPHSLHLLSISVVCAREPLIPHPPPLTLLCVRACMWEGESDRQRKDCSALLHRQWPVDESKAERDPDTREQ